MSKRQENEIRMARAVSEVLERHEGVWKTSKAFVNEVEDCRDLMSQLADSRTLGLTKTKGATEDKASLEETAINIATNLASRARVYARKKKLMQLYEQLNFTKWDLHNTPDNELTAKLKDIFNQLEKQGDALIDYNVKKENLAELNKATADYEAIVPKPRDIQIEVKEHHYTTSQIIRMLKDVFENMDDLLNVFEGTSFLNEYTSARIVIERGSRHHKPDEADETSENADDKEEDNTNKNEDKTADDEKDK